MSVAAILNDKGRKVTTARPDVSLQGIAEKLSAKRIGAIVIVGEGGRIAGIVSERDIIRAISERGAVALDQPVSAFMTSDVITCSPHDTADEVMGLMTQGRFRHVPVVQDGDGLIGIVSIGDVVKHHIAEVQMEATAMREYLATG